MIVMTDIVVVQHSEFRTRSTVLEFERQVSGKVEDLPLSPYQAQIPPPRTLTPSKPKPKRSELLKGYMKGESRAENEIIIISASIALLQHTPPPLSNRYGPEKLGRATQALVDERKPPQPKVPKMPGNPRVGSGNPRVLSWL